MLRITAKQKEKLLKAKNITVKRKIVKHHYVNVIIADGKIISKSKWNKKQNKAFVENVIDEITNVYEDDSSEENFVLSQLWERRGKKNNSVAEGEIRLVSKTNFSDLSDDDAETKLFDMAKKHLSTRSYQLLGDFRNHFKKVAIKTINRGTSIDDETGIYLTLNWGGGDDYKDSRTFDV